MAPSADPADVLGSGCGGLDEDLVVALYSEEVASPCYPLPRLGSTLDRIYEYGIDDVLSEVAVGYLRSDEAPWEYSVHTDTTTLKLFGAYEGPFELGVPEPRHGHSKDHRPDLLQLVFGLSLHGAVGIPLCVSVLDGNTSDHVANRFHIDQLAGLLPPQDQVTLVADCKLFDPATLGLVLSADFHFVTLVPRTCNLREQLVDLVLGTDKELPELSRERGRTSEGPERVSPDLDDLDEPDGDEPEDDEDQDEDDLDDEDGGER